MTLKQRCCNWKVMKNSEKLQPFCMFNKERVFHLKKGEKKLRMMNAIMRVVKKIAREKDV